MDLFNFNYFKNIFLTNVKGSTTTSDRELVNP